MVSLSSDLAESPNIYIYSLLTHYCPLYYTSCTGIYNVLSSIRVSHLSRPIMLGVGIITIAVIATLTSVTYAAAPYCTPGNPCFPGSATLAAFNASVDGRLLQLLPYPVVCYEGPSYNASSCATLVDNQEVLDFRAGIPAALMYTNYELAPGNVGCVTPPTVPSAPITNATCTIGGLAAYIVNATTVDHVSRAVKFAAAYNLRLRIKNVRHSENSLDNNFSC